MNKFCEMKTPRRLSSSTRKSTASDPYVHHPRTDLFTPSMARSLRFLEKLLAPGEVPVREFRPPVDRPMCILYTDAMWREASRHGGIGICLLVKSGNGWLRLSAAGKCPEWLIKKMTAAGSTSIINELEFVAILCAHLTFKSMLHGRRVLHFIDNTTALAAAVNGTATSEAMRLMSLHYAFLLAKADCECFCDWVPSGANPSDIPSRLDEEAAATLAQHGFQPFDMVWPEEASWDIPAYMLEQLKVPRA